jgi:hypothetical protein
MKQSALIRKGARAPSPMARLWLHDHMKHD